MARAYSPTLMSVSDLWYVPSVRRGDLTSQTISVLGQAFWNSLHTDVLSPSSLQPFQWLPKSLPVSAEPAIHLHRSVPSGDSAIDWVVTGVARWLGLPGTLPVAYAGSGTSQWCPCDASVWGGAPPVGCSIVKFAATRTSQAECLPAAASDSPRRWTSRRAWTTPPCHEARDGRMSPGSPAAGDDRRRGVLWSQWPRWYLLTDFLRCLLLNVLLVLCRLVS